MTNKKSIKGIAIALIVISSLAITANAEVASTTKKADVKAENRIQNKAENQAQKMTAIQSRDYKMIDQRITGLNKLLARIQEMRNVSDSQKTNITSVIQGLVTEMTALKGKIGTDVSTTTLKTDSQSIMQAYRIYALVEPQLSIIAAADRTQTVIGAISVVGNKVQARLNNDSVASSSPAVKTAMADLIAKLTDANIQSQAAANDVLVLVPDNGDKTKFQSNLTVLKAARTKIQTAQKDIVAVRKDLQTITKVLKESAKNATKTSTSTSTN